MICEGCGASYDSAYNYCPWCSRARAEPPTGRVQVEGDRYGTCGVEQETVSAPRIGKTKYELVACAVGPKGQYVAAESLCFTMKDDSDYRKRGTHVRETLDALVRRLCAEGWESLVGVYYFPHWLKFRRPVKGP